MADSNKITDDNRIAWCIACTLAEAMKDCKACEFNIGLPFRAAIEAESKKVTIKAQIVIKASENLIPA